MNTYRTAATTLFIALSLSAFQAKAAMLDANGLVEDLFGTTAILEPILDGAVVVGSTESISFSFLTSTGNISGTVDQHVVRANDGTFDFYWRVTNDATSTAAIGSFLLGQFASSAYSYNANWIDDGSGNIAPDTAFRNVSPYDSDITFGFTAGLPSGQTSKYFFLDTNATSYAKTATFTLSDGNVYSDSFQAYSPTSVPVPAAVWLLGSGLTLLAGFAKRKQR